MNALLQPRFKGATAFDVAVISNVLCRLASQPKYARHHRALKEMMSEIAITCDSVMEVIGCDPTTIDSYPVGLKFMERSGRSCSKTSPSACVQKIRSCRS